MFSILVSILFFILFVRSFYKQILPSIIKQRKNKYFYIGCCLIALSSGYLIVHNIKQNPLGQLFAGTVRYMNRYNAFAENKKKRASMINQNLSFSENNEKGIYVLVIGESQNRLHMSVYGYGRETTPWLNQQHNENPDFLLFTQAYSCHTHTVPTLTYALTAKNQTMKYLWKMQSLSSKWQKPPATILPGFLTRCSIVPGIPRLQSLLQKQNSRYGLIKMWEKLQKQIFMMKK